jgi:uncharacterized membrane protein YGL010W
MKYGVKAMKKLRNFLSAQLCDLRYSVLKKNAFDFQEVRMFAGKSWDEWIRQYAQSHQHPANRFFHTLGIPLIAASILLLIAAPFVQNLWKIAAAMFVIGWIFQFVGHWFEGKPPEFFRDWRFLFVGLRWWFAKLGGRA